MFFLQKFPQQDKHLGKKSPSARSLETKKNNQYILFISGPTSSGKTDFSIVLANLLCNNGVDVEIINADIGQFYTPLSIGTAKPNWREFSIKHHLFDIVDTPVDFNVCSYRELLIKKVNEIWQSRKIPIVVGGSLFYIKSLFFPPDIGLFCDSNSERLPLSKNMWEELKKIDPKRASQIHPNDTYRIGRALAIWEKFKKLPSECEPVFNPEFNYRVVFIRPEASELYARISFRTKKMINDGWIAETKNLIGGPWEPFLKKKKLIGYSEIFDWIESGEKVELLPGLIDIIQQKTRQYAKRQVTFWKKFRNLLDNNGKNSCVELKYADEEVAQELVDKVLKDIL